MVTTPRLHVSFVDDKEYAKEFRTGDRVRKTGLRDFVLTPYAGRVLYSNTDTGVVSVQWPWGVENNAPTELVLELSGDYGYPVTTDQSYETWESSRWTSTEPDVDDVRALPAADARDKKWRKSLSSVLVKEFELHTMPVYRAACKAWYDGVSEVNAIFRLSSEFSDKFGYDVVRRTVGNLYELGHRIAIYWGNSNRQYRVTQTEKSSGKLKCPRCAQTLKPRTFRANNRRLMQCRACGFSIHSRDLVKK